MTNLFIGILAAAVATNQPEAISNLVKDATGLSVTAPELTDPAEKELDQLMQADNAAQGDVDRWIVENNKLKDSGGALKPDVLNAKIMARFASVKQGYKEFLEKHPRYSRGMIAYGSFLNDLGDEDGAIAQFEKAREADPLNPAAWNQAANYYGHRGPVTNSFIYYAKAIELDTNEAVYYQNLATTVFLFRKDAREFYHIDEQQVFDKALGLYRQAMKADPENFELAQDVAQTYYGIRPPRFDEALQAWTNALKLAGTDYEKEGVYVHFARWNFTAGRLAEAHQEIDQVTNVLYGELKRRLLHNILQAESELSTNSAHSAAATNLTTGATNHSLSTPPKTP